MRSIILALPLALSLGGCMTAADSKVASVDAKLRDKCAYLQSGVAIARIAASFAPKASTLVERGSALIDAYCTGEPIRNVESAMRNMENVIVAIRPIANQIGK